MDDILDVQHHRKTGFLPTLRIQSTDSTTTLRPRGWPCHFPEPQMSSVKILAPLGIKCGIGTAPGQCLHDFTIALRRRETFIHWKIENN
jgi:hypothetical protein